MKGIRPFLTAWTLSLSVLISSLPNMASGSILEARRRTAASDHSSSYSNSLSTPTSSYATATQASLSLPSNTSSSTAVSLAPDAKSTASSASLVEGLGSVPTSSTSNPSHTLVIVLSTVLGVVGILLISTAVFFIFRYRNGRSPFSPRGASPINDDEIASWRLTASDPKPKIPADNDENICEVNSITLVHPPEWSLPLLPVASHPVSSPPPVALPDSPTFVTKAPNSRAGLTDETFPGADPFITPLRRQSTRLSKMHPGHGRSKSRRSSMSTKSISTKSIWG